MKTNEQPKELSFLDFATSLAELESEEKVDLTSRLLTKKYGKGELILESENTCSRIYFVETGLFNCS